MKTEIVKFDPHALSKETQWKIERENLLALSLPIKKITGDRDLEVSGKIQTKINRHIKDLGQSRLTLTRKIDDLKKQITGAEKEMIAELKFELDRLKKINSDYATEQMRIQEEERRKAEEQAQAEAAKRAQEQEAEAKKAEAIFGPGAEVVPEAVDFFDAPVKQVVKPKTSSNKFIEKWHFEIVNSAQLPREFLMPDESKIRAYVKSNKEQAIIPGIKTWKTVDVQSK